MDNTNFDINKLSPEQIQSIKESGGFSGSISQGFSYGTVEAPSERTPTKIAGYAHDIRPRIGPNNPSTDGLISAPSSSFPLRLAKSAQEEAARALAALEEEEEKRQILDISNMEKRIAYLERKLKQVEKKLRDGAVAG